MFSSKITRTKKIHNALFKNKITPGWCTCTPGCCIMIILHLGESQTVSHRKSVSLWQARNAKIVERRTFDLINYTRKYVELHKMAGNKTLSNLGTSRTENWPIIFNLLMGPIHPELNLQGIGLFGKFQILIFWWDQWMLNLPIEFSKFQSWITEILMNSPNHQERWSSWHQFRTHWFILMQVIHSVESND